MVLEKANQQGTVGCFLKKKPFCQHIFQVHNHNFVSAYVTSKMDSWPNGNGKHFVKRQLKTLAILCGGDTSNLKPLIDIKAITSYQFREIAAYVAYFCT